MKFSQMRILGILVVGGLLGCIAGCNNAKPVADASTAPAVKSEKADDTSAAAAAADNTETNAHVQSARKMKMTTEVVDLNNAKIEIFSHGKGEVVVLLPGGSLSVNYLANLAASLDAAGYRAVRINPRGAGASTGTAEGVTLHTLADDVAGVIKQFDAGSVFVAGHAFGNRVARMLASDHPELVKGVILLAAGGKVAPTPDAEKALGTIFDSRTSEADYLDAMQYMVGDPADKALAGEALKQSRAPKAGPIQRSAAMSAKLTDWWAPTGQMPFLILQGANDLASPPQNGEMLKADLGDRATLVTISGAGHLVVVTKPDVVTKEIVQFLRRHAEAGN